MRVDLLEMKTVAQIDLDDTPIVVVRCAYVSTAGSLDEAVGVGDLHAVDAAGHFTRLLKTTFGGDTPRTCLCPVRQFATQR